MKPVAVDNFKKYRFLSGLSYSPDGKTAVFVVRKAQKDGKGYTSDLWMFRDGELRRLTSGGKEGSFVWKNDNELFVFTSREDEDKKRAEGREAFTPLYTLRLDGGEAEKTDELPFRASGMKLWHDKVYAVSGSINKECPDYYKLSAEDRKKEDERIKNDADYEVVDEVPFPDIRRGQRVFRPARLLAEPSAGDHVDAAVAVHVERKVHEVVRVAPAVPVHV